MMKRLGNRSAIFSILGVLFAFYGCSTGRGLKHEPIVAFEYFRPTLDDHVRADSWGFDEQDSTRAIQSAIDSGAELVVIPNVGKTWYVNPINLASNLTLVLEEGVVIATKAGSFRGKWDCLFSAVNQNNISIVGYGAVIEMRKADYQRKPYEKSEWRHAISLKGCSNVLIEGVTIRSSGGDGIYIGRGKEDITTCENITIKKVLLEDHHRQGISVVSVRNLLVEDVQIYGTRGTAPSAGIDFEPNHSDEFLENCLIRRCRIEENRGFGVLVFLKKLNADSNPVSIEISESTIARSVIGLWMSGLKGRPRGVLRLHQSEIRGFKYLPKNTSIEVSITARSPNDR